MGQISIRANGIITSYRGEVVFLVLAYVQRHPLAVLQSHYALEAEYVGVGAVQAHGLCAVVVDYELVLGCQRGNVAQ